MKFSHNDLVPMLTIVAGCGIGLFAFGALTRVSYEDVPPPTLQHAGQVTGSWVMDVDLGSGGSGRPIFVLQQDGSTITGTYSGAVGQNLEVRGTVKDGTVKFSFDGRDGVVTYVGRFEGTTMQGTCDYSRLGEGSFDGRYRG